MSLDSYRLYSTFIMYSFYLHFFFFFFSSRRRHTRLQGDWSSDVCSSDLLKVTERSMSCQKISQLTRRPGHRATAQHVHMQMGDRLATLQAGVGHHPIA